MPNITSNTNKTNIDIDIAKIHLVSVFDVLSALESTDAVVLLGALEVVVVEGEFDGTSDSMTIGFGDGTNGGTDVPSVGSVVGELDGALDMLVNGSSDGMTVGFCDGTIVDEDVSSVGLVVGKGVNQQSPTP